MKTFLSKSFKFLWTNWKAIRLRLSLTLCEEQCLETLDSAYAVTVAEHKWYEWNKSFSTVHTQTHTDRRHMERVREEKRTKIYDTAGVTFESRSIKRTHTLLRKFEVCWTMNGNVAISIIHIGVCVVECHVKRTQIPHTCTQTPLCVLCSDGAS